LETFGVFEVFVEDSNGRRANLAPGKTAAVELTIPRARRNTAPNVVGLFSFDRNSGRWIEEGTLRRTPGRVSYISFITNLTTSWNADDTLNTTCIKVQILDCGCGLPSGTQNSHVEAYGVDYSGFSEGDTDGNGYVCLSVKRNAIVSVVAHHPSLPNVQSIPLEITTPGQVASASDCANASLCPLAATTHFAATAFFDDLTTHDTLLWCKSDGWANTDPNFDVGWLASHINFQSSVMSLMLSDFGNTSLSPCSTSSDCSNEPFASGEYRTKCFYGYGTYQAKLKTVKGSGLVTAFFTYAGPSDGTWHDEIDIEILGRPPDPQKPQESQCASTDTLMQTNYFVQGVGGHEHIVCLPFDASLAVHTYEFVWSTSDIKWYVDRATNPNPFHTETRQLNAPWPSQPGRIIVNMWAGSSSAIGWLGPFAYSGTPVYADYDSIQYSP
jgi:beta-glucanase (GH16 family)